MDLKDKSVTELKALVYDQLAMIENCQRNLKVLNEEISKRPKEDVK